MIILGLHLGHDGAACIVKDGRLLAALSSERLSRQRKSHGVTPELVDYVCKSAKVKPEKIDAIALSDYHSDYTWNTIEVRHPLTGEIVHDTWNRVFDNEVLKFDVTFRDRVLPGYNVGHHLSHCAAAFYTSPFEEAYCVSMDASGGELKSNFVIAHGEGSQLTALETPACCAGIAYGFFTEWLGLGSQMFKAGSLMAMASYGDVSDHVATCRDRHIQQSFFPGPGDYHYRSWMADLWMELVNGPHFEPGQCDFQRQADIGASIQYVFDNAILHCMNEVVPDGSTNVCLGGGSFLNCNVNSKVLTQTKFQNVHLFPACSDDGCAVGCALYIAHAVFGEPRRSYGPDEISYLGKDAKFRANCDYGNISREIAKGKVVAWVQGRSEYGPRALGHRSMLADPRTAKSRERINDEIKKREWFRPVCPSVLAEKSAEWFDFPTGSPYMLFTAQCKQPERVPGIVHVDISARMQTVEREVSPEFYSLIEAFEAETGIPMLVNTSLNEPGRPIIETDQEALEYFKDYPVDMLVLNGKIYEK